MKRFYIIFLLAALFCSCQKEEFTSGDEGGVTTLSVAMEDTKTSMTAPDDEGKRTVTWLAGDQINANGQDSNPLETGGGTTADFTFKTALTAPFNIIYPASFYKDATHIVLPYSQNKMPGEDNLATDTFPMYGAATSTEHIPVKHLCSMLKFQVRSDSEGSVKIAYLEFFGNNGEQICGNFEIDYATGALTGADDNALSKSVRCFSLKTSEDGATVVCNIVIPAGTYSKGFTIRVVDSNGGYMDKKISSSKTYAAGESVRYPAFEFVSTGKLDALCISSAQQLIAFAKDWNAYKFEGCNANVSLVSDIVFDETTSEEFVATAGIGTAKTPDGAGTNHYNGVFNGNGFSIKNLTSTVPVFATTGGGADIKNIIIDESCTFSCTAGGAADWGVLAGRQKGSVTGCNCCANVTIEANTTSSERNIGGIIGRVYGGTVQDCAFAGEINFTSGKFTDKPLHIGGVAGTVDSDGSQILDCSFDGSINLSDGTTYGGPAYTTSKTLVHVAGIAAYMKKVAAIDGCTTSSSATITMGGTYQAYAGGICGQSTGGSIKNCTNAAKIHYASNGARATTTATYIGGILGCDNSTEKMTVSHCSNTARVETYCNSTTLAVGGIAGIISGSIDGCSNGGEVFRYNAGASVGQRNRYVGVGGVVGDLQSGASVSNSSNSGKMYSQDRCTDSHTTYDVGGIVGITRGSNKISDCECTSSEVRSRGDKDTSPNPAVTRDDIGGIAGNLVSTAVSGCTVSGVSLVNLYSVNCFEGGICGTMDAASSISASNVINCKCQYSAQVDGNKFGAIAGTTAGASSINDCGLSGKWSVDGGSTWTNFTLDNITCGTAFTGSGNTLYTKVYNLTGTVKCGSSGLANVVVSDGYSSTLTDSKGVYYLQARDSATCVNVSIPSGYMVSSSGGVPAFWKKLSSVSASSGIKTVNFTLNQLSNPEEFTIYMYADVQVRPATMWYDYFAFHSGDVAADLFSDIKDRAAAAGGNIIGLSLGDQIHQEQSAYTSLYLSSNELGKLSFPNFSIMGNHDYDPDATDYITGAANYESKLSPVRYSLNVGKFHVIMLDNARTKKVGGEVSGETKGMPLSTLEWLKSDLKYVPANTPIILCSHRPLFMEMYTGEEEPRLRDISTRSWVIGGEYADILSGYKKVYAFNGDAHNVFNYAYTSGEKRNIECHTLARATGELWVNQFLNMCGTPRGYLEIKIDGDQLTYKFKPVAYQTGSCNKAPSPMTFRDFSVTDGKFYMKSSYLSAKGELLDDFYQIHAYAPGAGYGAATTYPNDVIAVVFMYDDRWSDVTFEYSGGSVTMTRIGLAENLRDPAYSWQYAFYKDNGLKSEEGYDNPYPLYNAFRCTPPSGVTAGTVKVTDHFGNTYENKISW